MKPRRPQPRLIIQGGTVVGARRDLASLRGEELSGSLLGTWVDIASESSRSRLCWTSLHNAATQALLHRLEFGDCDLEFVCILYLVSCTLGFSLG